MHLPKSRLQIGNVVYNVASDHIERFIQPDTTEWAISPEVAARFLSVDPLASNFPWWTPYQFAGNTPIQAIDLDGLELKTVVHYLNQNPDDSHTVVKTAVDIRQNYSETIEGKKYAKTQVYYIDGNSSWQGKDLYEPINGSEKELKPSAAYDYSQGGIDGKGSDDWAYINGGKSLSFQHLSRWLDTFERDKKAPDNAVTMGDVDDVVTAALPLYTPLGARIRNSTLAGSTHPISGVPFKSTGYPDFSNYLHSSSGRNTVTINYTGKYASDFSAANAAAGFSSTPTGFVWHHVEDVSRTSSGTYQGTMQLVEINAHKLTGHSGGVGLYEKMTSSTYKP